MRPALLDICLLAIDKRQGDLSIVFRHKSNSRQSRTSCGDRVGCTWIFPGYDAVRIHMLARQRIARPPATLGRGPAYRRTGQHGGNLAGSGRRRRKNKNGAPRCGAPFGKSGCGGSIPAFLSGTTVPGSDVRAVFSACVRFAPSALKLPHADLTEMRTAGQRISRAGANVSVRPVADLADERCTGGKRR